MNRMKTRTLLTCLLAGCLHCVMQTHAQSTQTQAQKQEVKARSQDSHVAQSTGSEGEKRFEANCGRCHNPPEDLSPREARAVLRQMRVRAMLSAEDERLILKYIAP